MASLLTGAAFAQAPTMQACEAVPQPPFCNAVRGVRSEGWPAQSRSEVMAQHGMVVTSQPLAAQAGLQILQHGGNAIDAAVATAAMLNVTEPMMVGVGGDLFAIIYVAKEHKIYVLNASGMAPTGATVERFNKLGYAWNPKNWGPGSGMPAGGILPVTVPGAVWGWQAVLERFGKLTFKEVLEPAAGYAQEGFPVSERIAHDWQLPNALPLQVVLHVAGSRFDQDLVRERRAAAGPDRFSEIPILRGHCACCSPRGLTRSTREKSRRPLSRSRVRSAVQ